MRTLCIIYSIISSIIAIGVLVYVGVDIVLEKKRQSKQTNVPQNIPREKAVVEAPVEIMPEPVPEIDVESADMLISDALAMSAVSYERGAKTGYRGIVNIGSIDEVFQPNDVVTICTLKEKGLLAPNVKRVKVLANGILHKPLTVKAEAFSVQAVKMIELTGGTVVILRD